jgi:hypothetical protein
MSTDHQAIAELQRNMEKLLTQLDAEAPNYAKACQIDEFMSDRRKSALADAFVAIRAASPEESAGAAEHRARASAGFKTKMQDLMKDQLNAETVKANYHVIQTRLEIARSFLAIEREKLARI